MTGVSSHYKATPDHTKGKERKEGNDWTIYGIACEK
jgi:hypothetical protein